MTWGKQNSFRDFPVSQPLPKCRIKWDFRLSACSGLSFSARFLTETSLYGPLCYPLALRNKGMPWASPHHFKNRGPTQEPQETPLTGPHTMDLACLHDMSTGTMGNLRLKARSSPCSSRICHFSLKSPLTFVIMSIQNSCQELNGIFLNPICLNLFKYLLI